MSGETKMRTIGIIGGLSWESSAEYYRIMNEEVARRLGGLSSARVVMSSVDFASYAAAMKEGRWDDIRTALEKEARCLGRAGAEALVVATNTMHRFAEELEAAGGVPLIHIADAAARAVRARTGGDGSESGAVEGPRRVGLMGTRQTMEGAFYRDRLSSRFGIEAIVPEKAQRDEIDRIIFDELCRGIFKEESKVTLLGFAAELALKGAESVILGCTELPLVMKDGDGSVPFLDTTRLHALAAVDFMLGDEEATSNAVISSRRRAPAYFIVDIRIKDGTEYGLYLEKVDGVTARFEGEYLAVDTGPVSFEGEREHGRIVVIRFPDEAALRRWYDSPEYQSILPHRLRGADCSAVSVRGKE